MMTGKFRRNSRRTHCDARGADLFPDRRLPPELEAHKPAIAQLASENCLGGGLLAAQLTGAIQEPVVLGRPVQRYPLPADPLTLPSPPQSRGRGLVMASLGRGFAASSWSKRYAGFPIPMDIHSCLS